MSNPTYQAYLASREWGLLKREVRERCHGRCEHCGVGPYEQTHHLTYEDIYHEDAEQLIATCGPCHEFLNGVSDYDPRPWRHVGNPQQIEDGAWLHVLEMPDGQRVEVACEGPNCCAPCIVYGAPDAEYLAMRAR